MAVRKVEADVEGGNADTLTMASGQKILAPGGDAKPAPGKSINWSKPQRDVDGTVPEFVNVTGKKQIIRPPESPGIKIIVNPWGVLRGAQFRHSYAEDYPGRKRSPKFIERARGKDGEYDKKFVLTVEQVVKQIRNWRGGLKPIDMQWAIKNIMGLRDNGAFKDGSPKHLDARVRDDRPDVINAVMEQRQYVEARQELRKLDGGAEIDDDRKKHIQDSIKTMHARMYPDEK